MTGGGGKNWWLLVFGSVVSNFFAFSVKRAVFKSISAFEFHSIPSSRPSNSPSSSSSFAFVCVCCVCGMVSGGMEREKGGTGMFVLEFVCVFICVCGMESGGIEKERGGTAIFVFAFVCVCEWGMVSGGMERERAGDTLTFVCTFVFGLITFVAFRWRAAKDERLGEADVGVSERVERGGEKEGEVVTVVVVMSGDAVELGAMFSCVLVMRERDWSVHVFVSLVGCVVAGWKRLN